MFTKIDAQLQAGNAPDIFRVPYHTFGSYAGRGQLLDLTSSFSAGVKERFTPAAWAAVQNDGKAYGVPHNTDTSVILYNKALLKTAGITSPTSLKDAWTWEEFTDIAALLREGLPDDKYPFAYNWQGNGVTRWLSWLFEADLSKPLIAVLFFMTLLGTWNDFAWPLIALQDNALFTLPIGLLYLQGQFGSDYGGTMAFALLNVTPMVILFLVFQRYFVQGFARSGIR